MIDNLVEFRERDRAAKSALGSNSKDVSAMAPTKQKKGSYMGTILQLTGFR